MFGDKYAMVVVLDQEDKEKLKFLNKAYSESKTSTKGTYASWIRYFETMKGKDSNYKVEVMVSLTTLPMCGDTHAVVVVLDQGDTEKFLNKAYLESKEINQVHLCLVDQILRDFEGKDISYKVEAMGLYWLSWFELPSGPKDGLKAFVVGNSINKEEEDGPCALFLGSMFFKLD